MEWSLNQCYKITEAGKQARASAEALLQAYPLPRACLEILGDKLLELLEFGFFTKDTPVIRQGASGRDIFLLCEGCVDVLVNEKVVVQMKAPVLLGDKALAEPNAIRAATIQAAQGQVALFLKIPMTHFVRDYKDAQIPDTEFEQEAAIFAYLFNGIQKRLFDYVYLQKNLWETVNTTQNLANSQVIAMMLDHRKMLEWDEQVWIVVRRYLAKELKFNWPEKMLLSSQTLKDGLMTFLAQVFPRQNFKGTEEEYLSQKMAIWKSWLQQLGSQIIKVLPETALPVHLVNLELFNPRNYRTRITHLLRKLEERFPARAAQGIERQQSFSSEQFFGTGEHSNEFNLQSYLAAFDQLLKVNQPRRIQAQIAQRVALIAANCENQFNASVIKMQGFLDAVQEKIKISITAQPPTEIAENEIQRCTDLLLKGYIAHDKKMLSFPHTVGELHVTPGGTPNIEELAKGIMLKPAQEELLKRFPQLLDDLHIRPGFLPYPFLKKLLYIGRAYRDDVLPYKELNKFYWIPIAEGTTALWEEADVLEIPRGILLGGPCWKSASGSQNINCSLRLPPRLSGSEGQKPVFMLAVNPQELPWNQEKKPEYDLFVKTYLPLMQWLLNKHLETLTLFVSYRDDLLRKCLEIEQISRLENKVSLFEQGTLALDEKQWLQIRKFLLNILNMKVEEDHSLTSDKLTKRIYNHIIQLLRETHPEMHVETRSNQAYTKWRSVLSGMMELLERFDDNSKSAQAKQVIPTFELLDQAVKEIVVTYLNQEGRQFIGLQEERPKIAMGALVKHHGLANAKVPMILFTLINALLEDKVFKTFQEIEEYQKRLASQTQERGTQENGADLYQVVILENTKKLLDVLTPQLRQQ